MAQSILDKSYTVDESTNILGFKPLYSIDSRGRARKFQFFMCVVEAKPQPKHSVNWDSSKQKGLPIQKEWWSSEQINNYAVYWQVDGYDKMTTRAPTLVRMGKNIGKKNATNVFTQAHSEILSKMEKKYKSGARHTVENVSNKSNDIYFPQLLYPFKESKITDWSKVRTQVKIDGLRNTYDQRTANNYSRTRKIHDIQVFKDALKNAPKNTVIDGEGWHHGMTLQQINSVIRGNADESKIQFHVFDIMLLDNPKAGFDERYEVLKKFVEEQKNDRLVLVPVERPKNMKELMEINKRHIEQGYEGTVVRIADAPYALSKTKAQRTWNVMKLKPILDGEYKVVDFTHGEQGDARDMIIWVLETPDGKRFKSNPTGTVEERKALLLEAKKNFKEKFEGRMGKIKYYSFTEDKIPFHSNFLGFRDPE